jgi:NTE family protein
MKRRSRKINGGAERSATRSEIPGQVVLVLQGGGALGAYQVGVYEALHEAGIEPDWVIGTSIGAINAALIAGNARENRIARLTDFWGRVVQGSEHDPLRFWTGLSNVIANLMTVSRGIPAFFRDPIPSPGQLARAVRHRRRRPTTPTAPLRETLSG